MSSSISFPVDLPVPSRDNFGDEFEETGRTMQVEAGTARRRNRMRQPARKFNLQLSLTQPQFAIFDLWWQDTINGGDKAFDIQLLDDDDLNPLIWYTVKSLDGQYSLDVTQDYSFEISFTVRTVSDGFASRSSGTDTLRSAGRFGWSSTAGQLLVFTPYRASARFGFQNARAQTNLPPLRGAAKFGLMLTKGVLLSPVFGNAIWGLTNAQGRFDPGVFVSYPELSRQWGDYDWMAITASQDISSTQELQEREWLEYLTWRL